MACLSKTQLCNRLKPKIEKVELVEFAGDHINLKALDSVSLLLLHSKAGEESKLADDPVEYFSKVIALTACDDKGNLLFDITKKRDLESIKAFGGQTVMILGVKALELSGVQVREEEAKKK